MVVVDSYLPERDRTGLWACKRRFETELGTGTGDETKAERYEGKLTERYRRRYFDWVDRCCAETSRSVQVAIENGTDREEESPRVRASGRDGHDEGAESTVVGYVFVLPESLSMIWDAAVLNEIYVAPSHRGIGLADDLMEAALSVAREQSLPLDRIVLDVDPDNERAVGYYERHGFEPWGQMIAREL